ncbi:MAG: hypothetical protein Q8N46_00550, partial [Anaerolineales bacterium]|nr:hypothetical protein [Anaerolineales bacterium]
MTLKDNITSDLAIPLSDLPASITYRSRTEEPTFDPETGEVTEAFTDFGINALRGMYSAREVGASGGAIEVGDVYFHIRVSDLTATVPKKSDRVVDGSETFNVIAWELDDAEVLYKVS